MKPTIEAAGFAGVLQKQLHLLRELAGDLVASRACYVAMDLDGMYAHTARQASLCEDLRQVRHERNSAWLAACTEAGLDASLIDLHDLISRIDAPIGARMRQIATELALAEGELRNLNRANSVLLEGSRRTLGILANVLASFAPTYSRPDLSGPALAGGARL